MSTALGPASPLLRGLVDDAALFPPGNAPMLRALDEHAEHRSAWYADVVGPFLCPSSRVGELAAALGGRRLRLALVDDGDLAAAVRACRQDERLELAHVETRLPADAASFTDALADARERAAGAPAVVELPRGERLVQAARAVASVDPDQPVKLRTGGTTAQAFPSDREVALFLRLAVDLELSFKLTAGLHRAVRSTAEGTGFEQHGFLSVLAAVRMALQGEGVTALAALLEDRDPERARDVVQRMSDADAAVVRSFWLSFGCCGVTDPVDDLVALGVLARPAS